MANTKTVTVLVTGKRRTVVYATIAYVDAQETNMVIYDSSAIATTLGIADHLKCRIKRIFSLACTASTARINLLFDATAPVVACGISNLASPVNICFDEVGGLKNYAGTGITGDVTLTTTGLAAGDTITLLLEVEPG
jgi:hypothetical protein